MYVRGDRVRQLVAQMQRPALGRNELHSDRAFTAIAKIT